LGIYLIRTHPFRLAQNLATVTASGDPITLSDTVKYHPSSNVLIPMEQREEVRNKYIYIYMYIYMDECEA